MENVTPVQKMMIWILKNCESHINEDVEKDADLDDVFEKTIDYEYEKMKEIFIEGMMLGIKVHDKKYVDYNQEFDNMYKKLFPEE